MQQLAGICQEDDLTDHDMKSGIVLDYEVHFSSESITRIHHKESINEFFQDFQKSSHDFMVGSNSIRSYLKQEGSETK
jgi:hypothetical protein